MRALALLAFAGAAANAADFSNFSKDIQPLLEENCTACHGTRRQAGGVRLDTEPAFARASGARVLAAVQSGAMPPGERLAAREISALREWVQTGAAWPGDLVIATGGGGTAGADNMALVRRIHDRIASKNGQPFKTYDATIPGTAVSFQMVAVAGGEFQMGSAAVGPVHAVRVSPFWMGSHEVTWDEYRLFMFAQQAGGSDAKDPQVDAVSRPTRPYVEMSFGMGIDGFPAISMTQHAANKYAEWLSAKTGQFYRLPTEAEWEYACRAGSPNAYPAGTDPAKLGDYAWFDDNSDGKYQKVGTKKPNAWGLYDMLGNAMEWTLDQMTPYHAGAGVETDPWVKASASYPQVVRGGSWADGAAKCRCDVRVGSSAAWKQQDPQLPKSIWYHTDAQGLGFRLVRPLQVPAAEEMFKYWNNGVERD